VAIRRLSELLETPRRRTVAAGTILGAVAAALIAIIIVTSGGNGTGPDSGTVSNGANGRSDGDSNDDGQTATPAPTTAPTPATVEFIEPPAGFTTPLLLGDAGQCTFAGDASAVLTWQPSPAAEGQEVNLLLGSDNFVPGNYLSSGSLDGDITQFTQEHGLRPGGVYFWRVNTRVESGWVAGEGKEFETARCPPADEAQ